MAFTAQIPHKIPPNLKLNRQPLDFRKFSGTAKPSAKSTVKNLITHAQSSLRTTQAIRSMESQQQIGLAVFK
jgi:hypothetical protein